MITPVSNTYRSIAIDHAIEFVADPLAKSREYAAKHGESGPNYPFACGQAESIIRHLLDVLGYPEQGPSVNQWSWVDDDDEDDAS